MSACIKLYNLCESVYSEYSNISGTLSEYQQNLPLYGIFSVVNGVLGACVFFFHCSNNQQVSVEIKEVFTSTEEDY